MISVRQIDDVTEVMFNNLKKLNILVSDDVKTEFDNFFEIPNLKLLVNMEGIEFIDSSGFAIFLSNIKRIQKNNVQMIFCNVSNLAFDLFKVLHLHTVFKIIDCRTEALKSFE